MALMRDRIRYVLKKPGGGRRSFAILEDRVKPNGRRESRILPHEAVDAVNRMVQGQQKPISVAELELREVIAGLYQELDKRHGTAMFNEENRQALEAYWDREYDSRNVQEDSLQSARNCLNRAIEAVGRLSLASAPRKQLQAALNKRYQGNKQRTHAAALNQVLKFLGRDFELTLAKPERRNPRYLTPEEFARVLPHVQDERFRLFFGSAIATGGRTGEVFAIEPHHVRNGTAFIRTQLDRNSLIRETKNGRQRHVVLMPAYAHMVAEWVNLPDAERLVIRHEKHAKVLKAACAKVFPGQPKKHCDIRDLRHSYAIWLLNQGVSIGLVAQSLGNSELVCQEYYAGFVLAPESVLAIQSILSGPGGEIGRRMRLKIARPQKGHAGSIPARGTTKLTQ